MEQDHHDQVVVVMVPLPCQSHLNQLLQLSSLIASYGLPVHFIGSATHNRQAKLRSNGLKHNSISEIQFHDLPTPPISAPEPDPTMLDKVPVHLWPANEAYMNFRKPIYTLVEKLSLNKKRVVIIYDRLVSESVRDAVLIPNAESYAFNCLSTFNLFYVLWESKGKPFELEGALNNIPSMKKFIPEAALEYIANNDLDERHGDIHNTTRLVDRTYIDLMGRDEISGKKSQWAITPTLVKKAGNNGNRHKCMEFLDKQEPRSVIYVSFGTTTSFTNEEAKEIAMGLEMSKKKFVWVLRDADKADIFVGEARKIELPEGFEERVKENGIIVRDWAPQFEILSHESVGGFMSHCGWNSCLESLVVGVPIVAWPMHSDQPLNAIFLTEILRVGVIVREWETREGIVNATMIKSAVEKLIGCEEGDEIRRRAEELSFEIKKSVEKGGEFCLEMDAFMAHIRR